MSIRKNVCAQQTTPDLVVKHVSFRNYTVTITQHLFTITPRVQLCAYLHVLTEHAQILESVHAFQDTQEIDVEKVSTSQKVMKGLNCMHTLQILLSVLRTMEVVNKPVPTQLGVSRAAVGMDIPSTLMKEIVMV